MIKKSPYQILGLEGSFDQQAIKKAYRKLIRTYPPEQNPQEFAKIRDAYDFISNEEYFIHSIRHNHFGFYDFEFHEEKKGDDKLDVVKYLQSIFETPFEIKEI